MPSSFFWLYIMIEVAKGPENSGSLSQVKNVVAVASGKGGVGKSTTAVNLALALKEQGAKVGLLDADIYGPSIALMLGLKEKPTQHSETLLNPVDSNGLKVMSIALLTGDTTPMVWRGPMASGALQQMINQTNWGELDYLIVDMPPGTGDIQLTVSQKIKLAGAVIVTTPQEIALLDAKRGIEMFQKVSIPVVGIVENMSLHICENCGHEDDIFGANGGVKLAQTYKTKLLGQLPIDRNIRDGLDQGKPVVSNADSEKKMAIKQKYLLLADNVLETVNELNNSAEQGPTINISND